MSIQHSFLTFDYIEIASCQQSKIRITWMIVWKFRSVQSFMLVFISCFQNGPLPFSKFEFLVAWILREVLSIWMTIQSHKTSIVQWRHKKYRVLWGGTIEELVWFGSLTRKRNWSPTVFPSWSYWNSYHQLVLCFLSCEFLPWNKRRNYK